MKRVLRLQFPFAVAALALALAGCHKQPAASENTASSGAPSAIAKVPGPPGGWTEQIAQTDDGGFRMGNPDAPVKLVEYGSLTCPHCAAFSAEGGSQLETQYVSTGKVSYEFRNFVRDPYDFAAALLARCGGPKPFFKLTEQMFATQQDWVGKLQKADQAELQRINALPQNQMFGAIAKLEGLDEFVRQRGISQSKIDACLTDKQAQDKLIAIRDKATNQLNVTGTPTFFVNGNKVDGATWLDLEPVLRAALH